MTTTLSPTSPRIRTRGDLNKLGRYQTPSGERCWSGACATTSPSRAPTACPRAWRFKLAGTRAQRRARQS